jgi:hypothetical protein
VADKNQKSGAAAHKSLQNETSRTRIQVGKCQHGGTKALNHAVSSSGSDSELSDSSKIVDMTPGVISWGSVERTPDADRGFAKFQKIFSGARITNDSFQKRSLLRVGVNH